LFHLLPAYAVHHSITSSARASIKLIRAGLLEEVSANGSLLAWRRDAEAGVDGLVRYSYPSREITLLPSRSSL
jgi:hypothetical protein